MSAPITAAVPKTHTVVYVIQPLQAMFANMPNRCCILNFQSPNLVQHVRDDRNAHDCIATPIALNSCCAFITDEGVVQRYIKCAVSTCCLLH